MHELCGSLLGLKGSRPSCIYMMTESITRSPYPFTKYGATHDGEIFRLEPFKSLGGHQNQAGYVVYGLTSDTGHTANVRGHRFVYECFYPDFDKSLIVDHDNQVRCDNRIDNLQAMTTEEHNAKTLRQNPQMIIKRAETMSKAVVQEFVGCGKKIEYVSLTLASQSAGVHACTLSNVLYGDGVLHGDDTTIWSWKEQDIPGERWYKISHDAKEDWHPMGIRGLLGLDVSDQGRVKLRGRYTYGSLNDFGTLVIGYNGHLTQVHQAVCLAFHGPPPEFGLHVKHINGDALDNTPDNLRWSTSCGDPPTCWCSRPGWDDTSKKAFLMKMANDFLLLIGMGDEDKRYQVHISAVKQALETLALSHQRVVDIYEIGSDDYNPYKVAKNMCSSIGVGVKRRDRKCKRSAFHILVFTPPNVSSV